MFDVSVSNSYFLCSQLFAIYFCEGDKFVSIESSVLQYSSSMILTLYCLLRTKVHELTKFRFYNFKGPLQKFPMSVATMSR